MTSWYDREGGALLADELAALRDLCGDVRVDPEARELGHLVVYATVDADRLGPTPIAIVYPGTFPHTRPAVYQMEGERLGRHQHRHSGHYCLIGRSSDQWSPDMRAADLVAGLPELVRRVDAGGVELLEAEDPQGEPQTTYFQTMPYTSILVPEALRDGDLAEGNGRIVVQFASEAPAFAAHLRDDGSGPSRGLLVELIGPNGEVLVSAPEELRRQFAGEAFEGTWTAIGQDQVLPTESEGVHLELAALNAASQRRYGRVRKGTVVDIHAIVMPEEVRQGEYAPGILFVAQALQQPTHASRFVVTHAALVRAHVYGRVSLAERIKPVRTLRSATAAAVGLGTLGAPLVRLLAQAQIGTMRLADYDVVDPNTTVRWPGGITATELPKADLLSAELARDYPFVGVVPCRLQVGSTPHPEGILDTDPDTLTIDSLLAEADLMIDATANDNATRALCAEAHARGVPQLVVYGIDGYGGVVAMLRPGETGCHHCLSLALTDGGTIPPAPSAVEPGDTQVQPQGCDEPTFVAVAPDLMPLVAQAARAAMSYLTRNDANGYGRIAGDVFILATHNPDGTPLPAPRWAEHDLPVDPRCPNCA